MPVAGPQGQLKMVGGVLPAGKQMSIEDVQYFFGQGGELSSDRIVQSVASAYALVAWIYRATRIRANAMSGLPYKLYRGTGTSEVDNPFTQTDMRELLWKTEASKALMGAAYWFKKYRSGELIWLNPAFVMVEPGRYGPAAFLYNTPYEQARYAPKDVIYLPNWNPVDDIQPGPCPARVALEAANLGASMNEYAARFFGHGAVTSVILSTDQIVPDVEIERVRTVWERLYSGLRNAWRTVVLHYGLKPTLVGQKINDLAMPDLSKEVQQQVAAAFEMSRTYLVGESANRATDEEETLKFYSNTIIPNARLLESAMNAQLWKPLGYRWEYVTEEIEAMQQNEAKKASAYTGLMDQSVKQLEAGVLTRDRAVWITEQLWSFIGFEFPEDKPDEEPKEEEPAPQPIPPQLVPIDQGGEEDQEPPAELAQEATRQDLRILRRLVKKHGATKTAEKGFQSAIIPESALVPLLAKIAQLGDEAAIALLDELLEGADALKAGEELDPARERPEMPATEVDITEADIERAIRAWDKAIPELAGILEADVIGRTDYD